MGLKSKFQEIDINMISDEKLFSYKDYDNFIASKLEVQIKKNGQLKNIVVTKKDDKYVVIDGYFIFQTMKKLRYETIQACIVKTDSPELLSVELNVLFNKDLVLYAQKIKFLKEKFGELSLEYTLPMLKNEIAEYAKLLEFDFKKYNNDLHSKLFLDANEEYF